MKNVTVLEHPILKHRLSVLRDKYSSPLEFRQTLESLSTFIAFEATRDLELKNVEIETPLEKASVGKIAEDLLVIPILRAGLGMVEGFLRALPAARVGHVGIYRDKVMNNTIEYYFKLPDEHQGKKVLLLDPMLATGDTAVSAIARLKEYGVGPIRFVTILSSKVGLEKVLKAHPEVEVFTLSIERELNSKGYLLPGLGDAGDRLYHTTAQPAHKSE